MLAIITKMTLTQVSTWFANARRRLKKENKMTWSPKSKSGEERTDEKPGEEKNNFDIDDPGNYDNFIKVTILNTTYTWLVHVLFY